MGHRRTIFDRNRESAKAGRLGNGYSSVYVCSFVIENPVTVPREPAMWTGGHTNMFLSQNNAKRIVNEMYNIIHRQINMMDEKGYIIASTDPKREGQFHACALEIISRRLDKIVVDHDNEYEGTKEGINLPILLNGEIIGVVGITGDPGEVSDYGQIIKKMTEILLLDAYIKNQNIVNEKLRNQYIRHWLFDFAAAADPEFVAGGKALGIDVTQPYRLLIICTTSFQESFEAIQRELVAERIRIFVRDIIGEEKENLFFYNEPNMICMVNPRSDAQMEALADTMRRHILEQFGVSIAVGIDSRKGDFHNVSSSYRQAVKAMRGAALKKEGGIEFYDRLRIGIFIDEIPRPVKKEYLARVFNGCSKSEMKSWIDLLRVFFETNGSISAAAQKVYIHKNTLQYKLNKLEKITGSNPRHMVDAGVFWIAIQFFDSLHLSED